MNSTPTAIPALEQAGISPAVFRSASLAMDENTEVSLLRVHTLRPAVLAVALRALGLELPPKPGESRGIDPVLMCLRPGEWLLHGSSQDGASLLQRLRDSLPPEAADSTALLDFSDGLVALRLSGAAAPWLLAKLSGLDFLGAREAGQYCARTRMGQAAVVVNYRPSEANPSEFVYDLICDRSIACYLWELLQHCSAHAEELLASSMTTTAGA